MKIKVGDIDLRTYNKICDEYRKDSSNLSCTNNDGKQCPFYKPTSFQCKAFGEEFYEEEVEIPNKFLCNCEKEEISGASVAVTGTCWNSQQGPDGYRLQFETNNKALYKYMEKAAQTCIDIACANRKEDKNENSNR